MSIFLLLAGTVIFLIGCSKSLPRNFSAWGFLLVVGLFMLMVSSFMISKERQQCDLAKEVNMTQVPISGQKNFRAQIQIVYKDGKLDSVILVPKTTISE